MKNITAIFCLLLVAGTAMAQSVQCLAVGVSSNGSAITPDPWGAYDITPGSPVTLTASVADSNGNAITSTAADYSWSMISSLDGWGAPAMGNSSCLALTSDNLPIGDYHVTVTNIGGGQYGPSNTLTLELHVGGWQAVSMQIASPGANSITTATPVTFRAQASDKGTGAALPAVSYSWALYNAPNGNISGQTPVALSSDLASPPPVAISAAGTYYVQAQSATAGYTPGIGGILFNVASAPVSGQSGTPAPKTVTITITTKPSQAYKSWFSPSTITQQVQLPQ
jgi:hypothetical protein